MEEFLFCRDYKAFIYRYRYNPECGEYAYETKHLFPRNIGPKLQIYFFTQLLTFFFQINIDFDLLYPEKGQNFYLNWNNFLGKLITLRPPRDERTKNLLESLKNLEDDCKYPPTVLILFLKGAN